MKLIIINEPYESALSALFSTCIQAAESHKCCPNLNDLEFLEAAKKLNDKEHPYTGKLYELHR